MNKVEKYADLLCLRTSLKKIQQLSWVISKLDNRYDINSLRDKEIDALREAYLSFVPDVKEILDELQNGKHQK